MRRPLALVLAAGLVLATGPAPRGAVVVTYESLTVGATAVGLAAETLRPTGKLPIVACEARLEAAQIRYRFDGTDPTASEGTPIEVGDILGIDTPQDAAAIRFIRTGGTSGTLKVHCWR